MRKPPKPGGGWTQGTSFTSAHSALSTKASPEVSPRDGLCCEAWFSLVQLTQQPNLNNYIQASLSTAAEHTPKKPTSSFQRAILSKLVISLSLFYLTMACNITHPRKAKFTGTNSSKSHRKVPCRNPRCFLQPIVLAIVAEEASYPSPYHLPCPPKEQEENCWRTVTLFSSCLLLAF